MAESSDANGVGDATVVLSQATPSHTTNGTAPSDPNSKKRKRPEGSSRGSKNKKAKELSVEQSLNEGTPSASRSPTPPIIDKNNWHGFCEIESEPAYFSVILRELGVKEVTVREVFTMDPAYLQESLPQPIFGLILLFHYREFGNADQPNECPKDVWFANQLPAQNSCATLAMINILMNSADVQIGEHLAQFKDFTRDFTPYQRGEALSSFEFVKRTHNSFAKKMDILESDKLLSYKVHRAQRLKAQKEAEASRPSKKGTKSRGRRASADSTVTNDSAEAYEESGHHFIAFVPVGTSVWKLDGLDAQPTNMGSFDPEKGETWLSAVSDTIAALMAAGDDDYGVVALTRSPLRALRAKACVAYNTMTLIDECLSEVDDDWKASMAPGCEQPDPNLLGIKELLPLHPPDEDDVGDIKYGATAYTVEMFIKLDKKLSQLTASIVAETQAEAEEDSKAAQRRFDAGPVVKKWLEMLAENGHLEENLHRFMPTNGGKGKK
ncbi:hypothetical protein NX059_003315 [Plenodomus lindquistii]|nr:hypothetical protein NX059_003315 [Plenodomus lindquistii]